MDIGIKFKILHSNLANLFYSNTLTEADILTIIYAFTQKGEQKFLIIIKLPNHLFLYPSYGYTSSDELP